MFRETSSLRENKTDSSLAVRGNIALESLRIKVINFISRSHPITRNRRLLY